MKKKIMKAGMLLIAAFAVNGIQAQENDSAKVTTLKEVVISATRSDKDPFDVGRSVTLISQDEISRSVFNSVAELLSAHAGIYVTGTGQNPGMNQAIFLRGSNSNQTAILVDGMRISDVSTVNNTIDLSELPLASIDHIEIIRGSHSTLYGSSAIGGVINIITKKNAGKGIHVAAEMKAGQFGTRTSETGGSASVDYGFENGIFIGGFADRLHTNGLDATVDTVTDPTVFKNRDNDDWNKFNTGAKAGFKNRKFNVLFSYNQLQMKTDVDNGAYKDDDNYKLDFTRKLYAFLASYRVNEKTSFTVNAGKSDVIRKAVNDSSVSNSLGEYDHSYTKSTYSGVYSFFDAQCNLKLKSVENVAGISYSNEEMNQENYIYSNSFGYLYEIRNNLDTVNPKTSTTAAFLQTDINGSLFSNRLSQVNLLLGIRMNRHALFGNYVTYEINPNVKLNENTLMYASWSTGFNAPSLYQLFSPDRYYTSNLPLGNKELKPEKSISYEFGIRQRVNDVFSYQVSLFSSVTDNLIEYVYLWDKNIGLDTLGNDWMRDDYRGDKYVNLGKQTTHGMEISLNTRVSEKFTMETNLSFVSGKIEYDHTGIDSKATDGNHVQLYNNGAFLTKKITASGLIRRPGTANMALYYLPSKPWMIGLRLRYAGARDDIYYDSNRGPFGALATTPVEDHTLLEGTIRYILSKNFSTVLRVENISDTKYSEINGFTTRGRGFYLAVRFKI